MTNETFKDIEKLESDLWEAADNLRGQLQTHFQRLFHAGAGHHLPPARGEPI